MVFMNDIAFIPLASLPTLSATIQTERQAISNAAQKVAAMVVDCSDLGPDYKGVTMTALERMIFAQAKKAMLGDTAAFQAFIKEYANGGAEVTQNTLKADETLVAMVQSLGLDPLSLVNLGKNEYKEEF
jgi:hypothetical protein